MKLCVPVHREYVILRLSLLPLDGTHYVCEVVPLPRRKNGLNVERSPEKSPGLSRP